MTCQYTHIVHIKHVYHYYPGQSYHICVTGGCTGTLDGLVASHTRLAIYPTLAICCQRVVICASLDTGFKGIQVATYPANIKQLKSH